MNTGRRIYEARVTKGMSRMDLAVITGINPCQIRDYEINKHIPEDAKLQSIADALGVAADYLNMIRRY